MTSALSQSIREAVGGGSRCLCVTMGKMCVANRDKLFTAFAGPAEPQMIFLQYLMGVYKTVTHKNHPEIFILSQQHILSEYY